MSLCKTEKAKGSKKQKILVTHIVTSAIDVLNKYMTVHQALKNIFIKVEALLNMAQ